MYRNRILMAEVDSGGASVASQTTTGTETTQTESQAQATSAPAVDANSIAAAVRDQLFAELRRSGVLGKKADRSEVRESKAEAKQVDPGKYRQLDRAVTRLGYASQLSDSAYTRLEKAFMDESPEHPETWVREYFDGLGVQVSKATQPTNNATTQTVAAPRTEIPVSDRGGSTVSKVALEDQDLTALSKADIDELIKKHGRKWVTDKLKTQLRGRRLVIAPVTSK